MKTIFPPHKYSTWTWPRVLLSILVIVTSPLAIAEHLSMSIGFSLGPYAVKNGRGMLADITEEALATQRHSVRFSFMTNKESVTRFKRGEFDGVALTRPEEDTFFYSDTVITIQNVAIVRKDTDVSVPSMSALSHYRVAGFSGASQYLGQEFADAVSKYPDRYQEIADQKVQVLALYRGDVDVIIADKKIFTFFQKKLRNAKKLEHFKNVEFTQFEIFPPTHYVAAFRSKDKQRLFNQGLAQLEKSGRRDQIIASYERLVDKY